MYCIVECRLGVAINPKHKIKDHKIFYVIYKNQIDAVNEYLKRVDNKLPANITQCSIAINGGIDMDNPIDVINNIEVEDITLINYNPLSYIKAPLNTGVNKYRKDEDS